MYTDIFFRYFLRKLTILDRVDYLCSLIPSGWFKLYATSLGPSFKSCLQGCLCFTSLWYCYMYWIIKKIILASRHSCYRAVTLFWTYWIYSSLVTQLGAWYFQTSDFNTMAACCYRWSWNRTRPMGRPVWFTSGVSRPTVRRQTWSSSECRTGKCQTSSCSNRKIRYTPRNVLHEKLWYSKSPQHRKLKKTQENRVHIIILIDQICKYQCG